MERRAFLSDSTSAEESFVKVSAKALEMTVSPPSLTVLAALSGTSNGSSTLKWRERAEGQRASGRGPV